MDTMDDPITGHITVTGGDSTLSVNGAVVTVAPMTAWTTGATITITVDATTKNALGQTIDAAQSQPFPAP
jgi:hypothetical protein